MTARDGSHFDAVADLYDRARPGYPAELFDDLVSRTGLPEGARVLEIGCGTGQATRPMAERGYRIDAVELGENMARLARANLAQFDNVAVHHAAFEDWRLPDDPFDLVMSATAFHWLDLDVVFDRIANALRAGGHLAIIGTLHVRGGTEAFFDASQSCFDRYPAGDAIAQTSLDRPGGGLPRASEIATEMKEIEGSGRFDAPEFRRYEWERPYTTQTYIEVISTYTGIIRLEEADRRGLLDCVADIVDNRFGGSIVKRYLTQLVVARKAG